MAKLSTDPITEAEIREYLLTFSDFAFEIAVLNALVTLGFDCRHAGTYEDPVTGKARQYDIHAIGPAATGPPHRPTTVRLAVECKNLRPNYPLVIHCLPRTKSESFVDVVYASYLSGGIAAFGPEYGRRVRLRAEKCPYPIGSPVGKSADQVGKRNGEIVSGDQDTFDRLAQALNSAHALLGDAHFAAKADEIVVSVVIPLLVVPDNRLWVVEYDSSGAVTNGPVPVRHISYFVDRTFEVSASLPSARGWYSLSHLEICELGYVQELVNAFRNDERLALRQVSEARIRNES